MTADIRVSTPGMLDSVACWWGDVRGGVGACVTQDLGFYVVVRSPRCSHRGGEAAGSTSIHGSAAAEKLRCSRSEQSAAIFGPHGVPYGHASLRQFCQHYAKTDRRPCATSNRRRSTRGHTEAHDSSASEKSHRRTATSCRNSHRRSTIKKPFYQNICHL